MTCLADRGNAMKLWLIAAAMLGPFGAALAQGHHGHRADPARDIKALSSEEVEQYLSGAVSSGR